MSEFEFDEEIEGSDYFDFSDYVYKIKFKCIDRWGVYWGLNKNDEMLSRKYARKIEPKVWIWTKVNGKDMGYQVPQSWIDKIEAGEFE